MSQRLLTHYVAGLFIIGFLSGACRPKQDAPQPESVPTDLLATTKVDSVITLIGQIDFSTVSETGQGPTGTLIRWDKNELKNLFNVFTYDQQGHLIGTLERFPDHEEVVTARYQDDFLVESYATDRPIVTSKNQGQPLTSLQPSVVIKFKYDAEKRRKQALRYVLWSGAGFKLTESVQYEYNSTGQLQLTRYMARQENGRFRSVLFYWENGDYIRVEDYPVDGAPEAGKFYYNQQPDPGAHLDLLAMVQLTEHYKVGSGPLGSTSASIIPTVDYTYQYDSQGRLSTMRSRQLVSYNSAIWSEWGPVNQFTYAL